MHFTVTAAYFVKQRKKELYRGAVFFLNQLGALAPSEIGDAPCG